MKNKVFIIWLSSLLLMSCDGIDEDVVSVDEIINLEIYDEDGHTVITEAIGNGESVVVLKAQIPENTDSKYRTVTFRATDDATFLGLGENNDTEIVNNEGVATAFLKIPLDDKPIFISAEVSDGTNVYKSKKTLNLIGVEEIISLNVLDQNGNTIENPIRADGFSLIQLQAIVNYGQDNFNVVTFEKSAGTFLNVNNNAQVSLSDNHIAAIDFRMPLIVDRIYFSAKVGESTVYFDSNFIDPIRSYPDQIIIEPQTLTMPLDGGNLINIYLIKSQGQVSVGTEVGLEAFQILNGEEVSVGRFTGLETALTDVNGKVIVEFKSDTNDIDPDLPITIRVISQNDNGDPIQEVVNVEIEL